MDGLCGWEPRVCDMWLGEIRLKGKGMHYSWVLTANKKVTVLNFTHKQDICRDHNLAKTPLLQMVTTELDLTSLEVT